MATAPTGVDTATRTVAVAPPYSPGGLLLAVTLPANAAVIGLDLTVPQLDTDASPTVTLDVGDALDPDRYLAADTTGQGGGTASVRLDPAEFYRYGDTTAVEARIGAVPTTDGSGDVTLAVYWYPARSFAQLRDSVLKELQLLGDGRAPTAEEDQNAREALAETHEVFRGISWHGQTLANRGDLAWPLDLVPQFAARAYACAAAVRLLDVYAIPDALAQRIAGRAQAYERELREQVSRKTTGEPVMAEFY